MSLLIETIKCKDGKLVNLEFHQMRLEKAQHEYFEKSHPISLKDEIEIPEFAKTGIFRCRITFLKSIEKIEFSPHKYREIKSLKIVTDNNIDYHLKYSNREKLNSLFELRDNCDDIVIVKNGFISDSFAANIVLFDGKTWVTPTTPLLPGTQRAKLLNESIISEKEVRFEDLWSYKKIGLINALNNLEEMPVINIDKVFK